MTMPDAVGTCQWCAGPFTRNPRGRGRPRRFCSVECRIANAHYVEDLPGWQERLAELEAAAATYVKAKSPLPVFLRNEVDTLRSRIAAGPRGAQP